MTKLIDEFEELGMVKALKEAKDFNSLQYRLLLRLFEEKLSDLEREIGEKLPKEKEIHNSDQVGKVGTWAIASNQAFGFNSCLTQVKEILKEVFRK